MAETSPIGVTIIFVIGTLLVLWLPLRILAVWRGDKSAPPVPIAERKKRILGRKVFDVTDRNFPLIGGAFLFGVGAFAVGLGGEGVLSTIFGIQINGALMPVVGVCIGLGTVCGTLGQIMYLTDRPRFLMPPALRDGAVEHELPDEETESAESVASMTETLPDDIAVFERRRERYLRRLQTGSTPAFRRDPRMLSFLLDSIEGIDRLFEAYETEPSLEAAYRSLEEETINTIQEDALTSVHGQAIIAFESLDLLDTSHDNMTIDEEQLRTLGVDPATIDTTTDVYSIDEDDLFADYVTVIEALDPELVTVFDDRTIEAFRELELSLDDDSDEHVYDVARSDSYDFGRLDAYTDQLERLRSRAALSAFDDEIIGQLAGEVRRCKREINTPSFNRYSVAFLEELPSDMYDESTSLSTTPGGSLIIFDDDEAVELALIISKLDDVTLTRWSDDELRRFEDYFAVCESTVHGNQFDDQLTGRVLTAE